MEQKSRTIRSGLVEGNEKAWYPQSPGTRVQQAYRAPGEVPQRARSPRRRTNETRRQKENESAIRHKNRRVAGSRAGIPSVDIVACAVRGTEYVAHAEEEAALKGWVRFTTEQG